MSLAFAALVVTAVVEYRNISFYYSEMNPLMLGLHYLAVIFMLFLLSRIVKGLVDNYKYDGDVLKMYKHGRFKNVLLRDKEGYEVRYYLHGVLEFSTRYDLEQYDAALLQYRRLVKKSLAHALS